MKPVFHQLKDVKSGQPVFINILMVESVRPASEMGETVITSGSGEVHLVEGFVGDLVNEMVAALG